MTTQDSLSTFCSEVDVNQKQKKKNHAILLKVIEVRLKEIKKILDEHLTGKNKLTNEECDAIWIELNGIDINDLIGKSKKIYIYDKKLIAKIRINQPFNENISRLNTNHESSQRQKIRINQPFNENISQLNTEHESSQRQQILRQRNSNFAIVRVENKFPRQNLSQQLFKDSYIVKSVRPYVEQNREKRLDDLIRESKLLQEELGGNNRNKSFQFAEEIFKNNQGNEIHEHPIDSPVLFSDPMEEDGFIHNSVKSIKNMQRAVPNSFNKNDNPSSTGDTKSVSCQTDFIDWSYNHRARNDLEGICISNWHIFKLSQMLNLNPNYLKFLMIDVIQTENYFPPQQQNHIYNCTLQGIETDNYLIHENTSVPVPPEKEFPFKTYQSHK